MGSNVVQVALAQLGVANTRRAAAQLGQSLLQLLIGLIDPTQSEEENRIEPSGRTG